MPTYEENKDSELPAHFNAARLKEPVRRRRRINGGWEWITVPDDEYPEKTTAEAPAAVVRESREQSTAPANPKVIAGFNDGETNMSIRKETLLKSFEAREGTVREKVIKVLVENLNKGVPIKVLLKSAYGNQNEDNIGALRNVLRGVEVMIDKNKLPVKIENQKFDDGGSGYGLFAS